MRSKWRRKQSLARAGALASLCVSLIAASQIAAQATAQVSTELKPVVVDTRSMVGGVAASFLVPGGGQLHAGSTGSGLALLTISIIGFSSGGPNGWWGTRERNGDNRVARIGDAIGVGGYLVSLVTTPYFVRRHNAEAQAQMSRGDSATAVSGDRRVPPLAMAMSAVFPGSGLLYAGATIEGAIVAAAALGAVGFASKDENDLAVALLVVPTWFYAVIRSPIAAASHNRDRIARTSSARSGVDAGLLLAPSATGMRFGVRLSF